VSRKKPALQFLNSVVLEVSDFLVVLVEAITVLSKKEQGAPSLNFHQNLRHSHLRRFQKRQTAQETEISMKYL